MARIRETHTVKFQFVRKLDGGWEKGQLHDDPADALDELDAAVANGTITSGEVWIDRVTTYKATAQERLSPEAFTVVDGELVAFAGLQ